MYCDITNVRRTEGMTRLLFFGAVGLLDETNGQDTGGPFRGGGDDTSGQCIDKRGKTIPEGMLFEPGPDECQVCTCHQSIATLCRTVLCAPPQGCSSLRVGDACCEWTCDKWDDTGQVSDLGLRLVASAVTAILSLCLLFFLIYRLRQRKLRGRQNHLAAESFNSVGGSRGDSVENISMSYLHKPEERMVMGRPLPPSYSEAMQQQQQQLQQQQKQQQQAMVGMDEGVEAPPYSSIHHDPVISYPVATLGRLVLPPLQEHSISVMSSSSDTCSSSPSPRNFEICLPKEEVEERDNPQTAV